MTQDVIRPLRMGIMGCSDFAARTMISAMRGVPGMHLTAVASRTAAKATDYARRFDCDADVGYDRLLAREDVDCIYIALPTGLHPEWVARSLEAGKHVLVEKSFAPDFPSTRDLVALARRRNLFVTENFSFHYHLQYRWAREQIANGVLGEVHLFRSNFSFPPLAPGNFRYDASLGGGALLDAGAYMVKASRLFFGDDIRLIGASLRYDAALGIDIEGTAVFSSKQGAIAQVAFGFRSFYQCNWEFLGPLGRLVVERAYTAPPTQTPVVRIERPNRRDEITLPSDHHYRNKLVDVVRAVGDDSTYPLYWDDVEQQARHLDAIRQGASRL